MKDFEELTPSPEEEEEARARAQARRRAAAKEKKLRRSRKRWRTFIVIYSIVFLLLGAAGCYVLYQYSAAYEASLPEHVMDAFMAETTPEQWEEYICRGAGIDVSSFENAEELVREYYDAAVRGKPLSYRRDLQASGSDRTVYVVRGGGMELCTVTLVPKGRNAAGFGRQLWQLGEVASRFTLDRLESVTLEIDAPADSTIYVNGKALGAEYLTGEQAPVPDLTELESRFDSQPSFVRYRVEDLYGEITVTDDAGRTLAPERDEQSGVIHYVGRADTVYSFTVRAPENVTVSVNGAQLLRSDASREEYGVLAGLDAYTHGQAYQTLTYAFDGLYTQPSISAVGADGRELTPLVNERGELFFFPAQDDALAAQVQQWAEEFFTRYIDYTGKAYNGGRHEALLGRILPGTALYSYIRDSRDAMIWASATEVHYDELTFADFYPVGEDCFTCTIRYKGDFAATAWHESYTYEMQNAYELAFVRIDDIWYAAAMSAVAG